MSDWKPGDLALCVHTRPWRADGAQARPLRGLTVGAVYTVEAIGIISGHRGLTVEGVRAETISGMFVAHRFRKIRPHTPDEQDAETIRLLTGAPVKEPSHV